jgi:hypothetical protein
LCVCVCKTSHVCECLARVVYVGGGSGGVWMNNGVCVCVCVCTPKHPHSIPSHIINSINTHICLVQINNNNNNNNNTHTTTNNNNNNNHTTNNNNNRYLPGSMDRAIFGGASFDEALSELIQVSERH